MKSIRKSKGIFGGNDCRVPKEEIYLNAIEELEQFV
jgi:hypothetical protein